MKSSESEIIDLSIFHSTECPKEECAAYESCISILRLISSLEYYSSLKVSQNKEDQDLFINFIKEVYTHQILDD